MPLYLEALDEGPDIVMDRAVVVVGRHPQCDVRLDSVRVSRRHCCLTADHDEVVIRDLGSTNGIRIRGQRVEMGRVRPGDEVSIAHLRYRLVATAADERTMKLEPDRGLESGVTEAGADRSTPRLSSVEIAPVVSEGVPELEGGRWRSMVVDNEAIAAALRGLLPAELAERCQIQLILKVEPKVEGPSGSTPAGGSGTGTGLTGSGPPVPGSTSGDDTDLEEESERRPCLPDSCP